MAAQVDVSEVYLAATLNQSVDISEVYLAASNNQAVDVSEVYLVATLDPDLTGRAWNGTNWDTYRHKMWNGTAWI